MSAATAREHGCKGLLFKGKDESACLASANGGGTLLSRRFAEKLAVGQITKIKVAVTPSSRQEVGTRHNRLGLQSFGRRIRVGLGRDGGGDRGFEIHCYDGNHFSARCLRNKSPAICATDLSGNSKKKGDCATIAGRCVNFRSLKHWAAEIEEQRVL